MTLKKVMIYTTVSIFVCMGLLWVGMRFALWGYNTAQIDAAERGYFVQGGKVYRVKEKID